MLDPQKIPLYRVKQAYSLNEHEAQSLLHELSPDGVYPYELWQKAYSSYWKHPAAECSRLYKVENPPFPETHQSTEKYFPTETYAKWIVDFFFEMARRISVKYLENGFDYIIESTYDSKSAASESDRQYLFYPLALAEKNIANVARTEGVKDINVRLSNPSLLFKIFPDTIVVDKMAAIRYLSVVQEYPFGRAVKGITQNLVDSVIKDAAQIAPPVSEITPALEEPAAEVHPQEQGNVIRVSAALWEGKPPATIRDSMENEFGKAVIAYVLRNWCKISKTETGRLLSDKQYEDEKSYRNFVDDLLKEAASLTILKA